MKKSLLLVFTMLALYGTTVSQTNWLWAKQVTGTQWNQGYDVATDAANNVYVAGFYMDSATFGNQVEPDNCQFMCQTAFVVKYGADGTFAWTDIFRTTHSAFAENILVDHDNNIIVSGRFTGTIWIGPYTLTSMSYLDIFVAKITTAGNVLWVRQGTSPVELSIKAMEIDNLNNIYIAGTNWGPATFNNLVALDTGVYIVKYNSGGTPLSVISEKGCSVSSIAVSDDYNIFLSGDIYSTAVIGADTLYPSVYSFIEDNDTVYMPARDMLFVRYDAAGNALWHRTTTSKGVGLNVPVASTLDINLNLYVTGRIQDSTDFWGTTLPSLYGGVMSGGFILSLDSLGNVSWVKQATPVSPDGILYFDAITSKDNALYIAGAGQRTTIFEGFTFNGHSHVNSFILKMDTAGNGMWSVFDTTNLALNAPASVILDSNDDIVVTGSFEDSVHFGQHHLHAGSNTEPNLFVAKFHDGPVGIEEQHARQLSVYPNPAGNEVFIQSGERILSLRMYDVAGREISRSLFAVSSDQNSSGHTTRIDVSLLEAGMYVFVINSNVVKKVVVE